MYKRSRNERQAVEVGVRESIEIHTYNALETSYGILPWLGSPWLAARRRPTAYRDAFTVLRGLSRRCCRPEVSWEISSREGMSAGLSERGKPVSMAPRDGSDSVD